MNKFNWLMKTCGVFLLWATTAIALPAQTTVKGEDSPTFTALADFDGTNGESAYAAPVQGANGNIYGTTYYGGINIGSLGSGAIFKITPNETFTLLYVFCSQTNCPDGANPYGGLVQASNGYLYGTTYKGGANNYGTVFQITTNGTLTTLHSFNLADGANPQATLIQGTDGNFYGTTPTGGFYSDGTVFKVTPSGTLTTLHSFCSQGNCIDGLKPQGGLIQGTDGNFYGTAYRGGINNNGTVYKMTPSGTVRMLYSFCNQSNCADGNLPQGTLAQAANGDFYGTTSGGGVNGDGTIFKITSAGTLTTLHSFNETDGKQPYAGLILGSDGNLYGTTLEGGVAGGGTVFEVTPSGTFTMVYSLCTEVRCGYGSAPTAGVIQGTNGKFYGTTLAGGAFDLGTTFSLSVGLAPFVKTNPVSGNVGATVTIMGTKLTGATKVTFHGTPATFTVVSSSEITTTVPTGATNGLVKVVTPGGTLSSNVPFRVKP